MKKYITVIFVLFFAFAKASINTSSSLTLSVAFQDQQYVSHTVEKGETVYSIAKKYGVEESAITKLNPDARESIYEGLILIVPASASTQPTVDNTTTVTQEVPTSGPVIDETSLTFKTYKAKRKDNLYRLSKKYGVPQEAIKKYNKHLYSEPLRKGDKIRIPTNYSEVLSRTPLVTLTGGGQLKKGHIAHTVIAKETKYGIARKYGISIVDLEDLNPIVKDGLKEGAVIQVPQKSYSDSAIIDNNKYAFYEVEKGDTMYSLLRHFNVEADDLLELNPALENGLKEGMILKVPKGTLGSHNPQPDFGINTQNTGVISSGQVKGSLLDSISNFSIKRIAVMLPFGTERVEGDNVDANEKLLKNDRILRLSLDLYSGILLAIEDAKSNGISVIVDTYDTKYNHSDGEATNARRVENIIQSNDFQNTQAVIGPLLGLNINRASTLLNTYNIPIISPMSSNVEQRSNVFISKPSDDQLRQRMLSFMEINGVEKNIIIISDVKNEENKIKLQAIFPSATIILPKSSKKGYYLSAGDIAKHLSKEVENWVILETNDVPIISNVTTSLNAQVSEKKITLLTTNRGNAYDSDQIKHRHLSNLNFHFPSVSKELAYSVNSKFADTYEEKYGISPSDYAVRGYDLMYDTLLRLSYQPDLYEATTGGIETSYIENKFRYDNGINAGFVNDAIYLLKYTKDLKLEEVPFMIEQHIEIEETEKD